MCISVFYTYLEVINIHVYILISQYILSERPWREIYTSGAKTKLIRKLMTMPQKEHNKMLSITVETFFSQVLFPKLQTK